MVKPEFIYIKSPIYDIKEFFDSCMKTVHDVLDDIEKKKEEGYYENYGDYESAWSPILNRWEKIYYATINELNILIEKIYRMIVREYLNEVKIKNKKYEYNFIKNLENIFKAYYLNLEKCSKIIEERYKINISLIDGYDQVTYIRDMINAYKHRNQYKHRNIKEFLSRDSNILETYNVHNENIEKLIQDTEKFLLQLFNSTINLNNDY